MTMIDDTTAAVAVIESGEVSLTQALHAGVHFASSARRPAAPAAPHKIQWFTGNNKARTVENKALPDIAGWAIEQPDLDEVGLPEDFELHDAMSLLCDQGLAAPVVVLHQDEQGKPRPVRYWALERASLFVVCEGVPSKGEMYRDVKARWGIAWAPMEGQRRSCVQFKAYIKELMDSGYNYAFNVKLTSYCTDRMLSCLYAHVRVLDFADQLRSQTGDNEPAPYYAYALPTRVSDRTLTAGATKPKPGAASTKPGSTEEEKRGTKEVYYPVPMIPARLTVDYLADVAITSEQAMILEDDDRVTEAAAWSVEKSLRLINGEEQPGTGDAANGDDVPF